LSNRMLPQHRNHHEAFPDFATSWLFGLDDIRIVERY
jgi:hypothetical protein